MLSAEAFQSSLDRFLAARGKPATLQRRSGATVTMSAQLTVFMRGYQPDELVAGSGIVQGDSSVIVSKTDLAAASEWTGDPHPNDFLITETNVAHRVMAVARRPMDIGWDLSVRG